MGVELWVHHYGDVVGQSQSFTYTVCIYICVCVDLCQFLYLIIYLCCCYLVVWLLVCWFVGLLVCWFVCSFVCLYVYICYFFIYLYLFIYLCFNLSIYLRVYLSMCVFLMQLRVDLFIYVFYTLPMHFQNIMCGLWTSHHHQGFLLMGILTSTSMRESTMFRLRHTNPKMVV